MYVTLHESTLPTKFFLSLFYTQLLNKRFHSLASRTSNTKKPCSHGNHTVHSSENKEHLVYELSKFKYRQVQFVSFFSYGLAAYFIYLAPDTILGAMEHDIFSYETGGNLLSLLIGAIIIPCAVQYFRKQLVLKLYYNKAEESYRMVTQKATLRQRIAQFGIADIKNISSAKHMFVRTKFQVKNKQYFVYPFYFKVPADYNQMFGFVPTKK